MERKTCGRVLVVDDDRQVLEVVSLLLEDAGFSVNRASNAVDAMELLVAVRADAVLSDIKMPGVSGIHLLEGVHGIQKDLPVILMTGHAETDVAVEAIRRGAFDFIVKPYDADYLVHTVDKAVRYSKLLELEKNYTRKLEEEVKKAVRESLEAREEAEAASRAKSEFLAAVSHELRTPINGIMGMTELALATELTIEQRDCLIMAKQSAEELTGIIEGILDFSSMEACELEITKSPFDVSGLMDTIRDEFSGRAGRKGIGLTFNIQDDAPRFLNGDSRRLKQVLHNLLGNAFKFTEKGEIAVSVGLMTGGECRDHADAVNPGSAVLLFSIRDTGIGIPADKRGRIFESFTQADGSTTRKYGGTGLGLSISRNIVELMGGRIWVESEAGLGSTFHFTATLETCDPEVEARLWRETEFGKTQAGALHTQGLSILLAEDNEVNQKLTARILSKRGHNVVIAQNGREALEELERGRFDLVLMDVQMPEMDGFEAVRTIRNSTSGAFNPDIPVIAVTAYAMEGDRERCLAAGMNDYVSKPVRIQEVMSVINKYCPSAPVFSGIGRETGRSGPLPEHGASADCESCGKAVDVEEALGRLDGDRDLLETIWRAFLKDAPNKMREMRNALEKNEAAVVQRQAHSMKGAAASIGATALKDAALAIELAAGKGDLEKVRSDYPKLDMELRRVEKRLAELTATGI